MSVSLYVDVGVDSCKVIPTENGSNSTGNDEKPEALYITYNVMLAVITVVIMFSMGSGIKVTDLLVVVKKPIGPIIGVACQCLLMPAACFGYALALQLAPNLAIGMVLVGCCPGGSISNIICFWTKADVTLSIAMTTVSTTLSILFLPLNMFIYSRYWIEDVGGLPYGNMVVTVLYVWAAVILGFICGKFFPKSVPYLTKIGSVAALVLILAAGVIQGQLYPELFNLPWTAWFGAITMPIIGCVLGFILALLLCQKHEQRTAIGLETGIQNTALALTVIAITYESSYQASCYSQFVLLYTTFQVVFGIATIVIVWFYRFVRWRETPCNMKHKYDDELSINEADFLDDSSTEEAKDDGLLSVTTVKGDAFADPIIESNFYSLSVVSHDDVKKQPLEGDSVGKQDGVVAGVNGPYVGHTDEKDVSRRSSSRRKSSSSSSSSNSSVAPPPEHEIVTNHM